MSEFEERLETLLAEARASGELQRLARPLAAWARAAALPAGEAPGEAPAAEFPGRFGLIGSSAAMLSVFAQIERAAASRLPVLVTGETGTGKELVARALHETSPRHARPFLAENCAAVPANLLESELFGHKRGSFTGAVADRIGHFQAAEGGTLFLDEIGEMPLELQAKLLRALDQGEVRPVGADATVPVDVRIVAATNRDLSRMVAERAFREDLYYRVKVLEIELPPLRERNGDIEHLVRYFLARASAEGKAVPELEPEALQALRAFPWPGNVRQLQNEIERALALGAGVTLALPDLSSAVVRAASPLREGEVERS